MTRSVQLPIPMQALMASARSALKTELALPFSVYASVAEQYILNAPVIKPLLICVLSGIKQLGKGPDMVCPAGSFIFLSNKPTINMRNVPVGEEYCALLIEFDYDDFQQFQSPAGGECNYLQGPIDAVLERTLQQFMEWSTYAPPSAWHFRRKELLQILYQSGHPGVAELAAHPSFCHRVHDLVRTDISGEWSVDRLTALLAMSESTLRRKLQAEGADLHAVINRTRMGYALHLVQTTLDPIGRIAELCGYQSQSRFTEKFRHLFGITPSDLRKTRSHTPLPYAMPPYAARDMQGAANADSP